MVSVLSMGPPQADEMLRECIAMGADDAYLLSDRAFGGADTCATSTTIAAGIKKIGYADIILAGRQAIDGDTAQVGPQIARRLGIPSVTYVQKIVALKKGSVIVERQMEDGYEVLEVELPCLLTAVKELGQPRYDDRRYHGCLCAAGHGLGPYRCSAGSGRLRVKCLSYPGPSLVHPSGEGKGRDAEGIRSGDEFAAH